VSSANIPENQRLKWAAKGPPPRICRSA